MRDRVEYGREDGSDEPIRDVVAQLLALSNNDEACRLLGVEGVLADQLDLRFLEDALDYVSYDIAAAMADTRQDPPLAGTTMLPTLVAELKLCRLLGVRVDEHDLVQRVTGQMRDMGM